MKGARVFIQGPIVASLLPRQHRFISTALWCVKTKTHLSTGATASFFLSQTENSSWKFLGVIWCFVDCERSEIALLRSLTLRWSILRILVQCESMISLVQSFPNMYLDDILRNCYAVAVYIWNMTLYCLACPRTVIVQDKYQCPFMIIKMLLPLLLQIICLCKTIYLYN